MDGLPALVPRVIDVPVENDTALIDIGGDKDFVILTLRSPAGTRKTAARRVVMANGRDGLGGPYTIGRSGRNLPR
jgi:FAD-dependent urate hydroxylase